MRTVELVPGHELPAIGLGTWRYGESPQLRSQEIAAIHAALESGPRVIDTAEMYGSGASEEVIGEALSTTGNAENAFVVSKVLPYNASAAGTVAAAEASLQRLGLERLDLFLLHWRGGHPFAETIAGMEQLVDAGKIGAWGVSNLDNQDMAELLAADGGSAVATNQILYNPTRRGPELDLLPFLADADISAMAYSPVEEGRLMSEPGYGIFEELADKYEVPAATIALAWVIRSGNVLAIPMSRNPEHIQANIAAEAVELAAADLQAIDRHFPAPSSPIPLQMI
ncbi:aldo/keto reductase [Micrococcoides hystricis]|uniref:Aldo/keto reductase n=1 Tax=Micrococcoides hystricis TaxID=1572761 RepID=A0ABV6PBL6_9MICC